MASEGGETTPGESAEDAEESDQPTTASAAPDIKGDA
jgi:hypothetical protein